MELIKNTEEVTVLLCFDYFVILDYLIGRRSREISSTLLGACDEDNSVAFKNNSLLLFQDSGAFSSGFLSAPPPVTPHSQVCPRMFPKTQNVVFAGPRQTLLTCCWYHSSQSPSITIVGRHNASENDTCELRVSKYLRLSSWPLWEDKNWALKTSPG